jgi:hypothetical protein
MPIIERKPRNAFYRFRDHIRRVVDKTIETPGHVRLDVTYRGSTGTLEFVRGDGVATAVPLQTKYGELYLTLTQILEAVREGAAGRRYRLTTKGYAYRLLNRDDPTSDAVVRWEYDPERAGDTWCRHHVQVAATVALGGGSIDLNRAHSPTGWVTIEELLRFLIYELEVPSVTADWSAVCKQSERDFYEEFTSKRYKL